MLPAKNFSLFFKYDHEYISSSPEKGLVHHLAADFDGELGSCERQYMHGAVWRGASAES